MNIEPLSFLQGCIAMLVVGGIVALIAHFRRHRCVECGGGTQKQCRIHQLPSTPSTPADSTRCRVYAFRGCRKHPRHVMVAIIEKSIPQWKLDEKPRHEFVFGDEITKSLFRAAHLALPELTLSMSRPKQPRFAAPIPEVTLAHKHVTH